MGNSDLAIIINGLAFIIRGNDYNLATEALMKAIEKFKNYWEEARKTADKPEELRDMSEIENINIYVIIGTQSSPLLFKQESW